MRKEFKSLRLATALFCFTLSGYGCDPGPAPEEMPSRAETKAAEKIHLTSQYVNDNIVRVAQNNQTPAVSGKMFTVEGSVESWDVKQSSANTQRRGDAVVTLRLESMPLFKIECYFDPTIIENETRIRSLKTGQAVTISGQGRYAREGSLDLQGCIFQ